MKTTLMCLVLIALVAMASAVNTTDATGDTMANTTMAPMAGVRIKKK